MDAVNVSDAAARLGPLLEARYPGAAALACQAPAQALEALGEVAVRWLNGRSRSACPVDGTYTDDPPTITIYRSRTVERDNFTCLHELGHHLLTLDEQWQFTEKPRLGERARYVEETVVNVFAARTIIPTNLLNRYLALPVRAAQIRDLYYATPASATACLVRSMDIEGQRLVMLTDLGGSVWFADSTGEPYNPGKNVPQPAVARAIDRALTGDGTYRLVGDEGIVYRSGKANPWVEIDVAVDETMAFVVVHAVTRDSRAPGGSEWQASCGQCGYDFAPDEASGQCAECREPKCPECGQCACEPELVICSQCFVALSTVEAAAGRTTHQECY